MAWSGASQTSIPSFAKSDENQTGISPVSDLCPDLIMYAYWLSCLLTRCVLLMVPFQLNFRPICFRLVWRTLLLFSWFWEVNGRPISGTSISFGPPTLSFLPSSSSYTAYHIYLPLPSPTACGLLGSVLAFPAFANETSENLISDLFYAESEDL